MKKYLQLMRIKHYLKNILIFAPLIFSGQLTDINKLFTTILGFVSFSLIASVVYIINDLRDAEKDRLHPKKKNRPIASGEIKRNEALLFIIILMFIVITLNIILYFLADISYINYITCVILEILYLLLNIGYSLGLKNIPFLDVIIIVMGFIIRLLYGAEITNIVISNWLYLTVISGSFYMAFGKRRNEILKQGSKSRDVLKKYNKIVLNICMYLGLIFTIIFYCLWCTNINTIERIGNSYMKWTIPLFLIILIRYNYNIEGDSFGDPVDVIISDKILLICILIYSIIMACLLYLV